MPQVGPRKIAAGIAAAVGIKGAVVFGKFAALDVDLAKRGVERAVARIAGGQHAVEHVHTGVDAGNDIQRRAHAHEVTRLFAGQQRGRVVEQIVHLVLGLAHREAANGKTVKIHTAQFVDRALAQVFVKTALRDAKKQIVRRAWRVGINGALGPARGEGQRFFGIGVVRAKGHAFVQHHHDVRIKIALYFQHLFRREQML